MEKRKKRGRNGYKEVNFILALGGDSEICVSNNIYPVTIYRSHLKLTNTNYVPSFNFLRPSGTCAPDASIACNISGAYFSSSGAINVYAVPIYQ